MTLERKGMRGYPRSGVLPSRGHAGRAATSNERLSEFLHQRAPSCDGRGPLLFVRVERPQVLRTRCAAWPGVREQLAQFAEVGRAEDEQGVGDRGCGTARGSWLRRLGRWRRRGRRRRAGDGWRGHRRGRCVALARAWSGEVGVDGGGAPAGAAHGRFGGRVVGVVGWGCVAARHSSVPCNLASLRPGPGADWRGCQPPQAGSPGSAYTQQGGETWRSTSSRRRVVGERT
jgi:hypothetical protein